MRLTELRAQRTRNLAPLAIETDARFVVLTGRNGQGKTNVLEAVWSLAALRPLRGTRWRDVIAWGEQTAELGANVAHDADTRCIALRLESTARETRLDGVVVRDLTAYFDSIRAIALLPSDAEIVMDAPALRRRWLDRAAFTMQPVHLHRVQDFTRVARQKAAALRAPQVDGVLLDVLDAQLAAHSALLSASRADTLTRLLPHVLAFHDVIAGSPDALRLSMRSMSGEGDVRARTATLLERLRAVRGEEIARRRLLVGAQYDDVRINIHGHLARTFASRGQVRSMILSLKLGELLAAHERGEHPLFLLDELSTELDPTRTRHLVETLRSLPTQVWITTTDPTHLGGLPQGEVARYDISAGHVQRL